MMKFFGTPTVMASISAILGSMAAMYYAGDMHFGHHPIIAAEAVALAIITGLASLGVTIEGQQED